MLYALGLAALAASCSAPKDITYFQSLQNGDRLTLSQPKAITLEPDDKLIITVHTTDPRLNALFNLPSPTTRIGTLTQTASATAPYSQSEVTPYTVNSKGNIIFPVLGKIHVQGMTAEQLSEYLSSELESRDLAKSPIVTVEFVNLAVSVMGEVNRPGRVAIKRQDLSILDAISEAGDLTIYGLRDNVKVIRHENGTQQVYTVNLQEPRVQPRVLPQAERCDIRRAQQYQKEHVQAFGQHLAAARHLDLNARQRHFSGHDDHHSY